ncbi:MAG: tRNA (adenosine(37)-N6)-threonylcarbamoyltransferase complex ATPase subunit type 1 TsaE [Saprospiraceae bacterium]
MEYGLNEVERVATGLLNRFAEIRVFTLTGELGAGKTTLVKAICGILGVEDLVSSPTFSIINEYKTKEDDFVYHADLYRLKDEMEALGIGIEDYLDSGNYMFIEWAEVIEHLLPKEVVHIHIKNIDDKTRKILFL